MKKAFLIFLLCLIPLIGLAQQERQMPVAPDVQDQTVWFPFDGQWMPAVDASLIGPKNFKTLKNMRYIDGGLEGIAGYTKINTTALTTYLKGRSGFHFKKDQPAESHVLLQAYNTGLTASQVLRNSTAIPSQGDFNATALHTDATGAGLGRFAQGPQGTVIYNNGVESMIWGGDESPIGAFITSTATISNTITNSRDFTEQVRNTLSDSKNIAVIGGIDAYTELLLHMDGTNDSTTFTDSSNYVHTVTEQNDAKLKTGQKKFGTASGYFDGTGDYLTVPDDSSEKMPNQVDRDFSGASAWDNEDINAYDETADLTITASAADQYCYLPVLSAPTTVGRKYKLTFTVANLVSTWTVKDFTGTQTLGTVSSDGANSIEFTASYSGGLRIVAVADDSSADFDDFSLVSTDHWYIGTDAFTIDFWVRFSGVATSRGLFEQYIDNDNRVSCYYTNAGLLRFIIRSSAVSTVTVDASGLGLSTNTWYHIAIIRGWDGNANDWAITVDGIQKGTTVTDADPWPDLATTFAIGQSQISGSTYSHYGYIDEFRVSKGVARWTDDFTVPSSSYASPMLDWVIGSPRALQGVKYYVKNGNTETGTMTADEWNGSSWTSLSITDNTTGLAATGTVTWSSTVDTSKPRFLGGYYLYFYRFTLDTGNADIYYVTVDAPWQDITDIWDGVYRQPIAFQASRNDAYEDWTLEVNEPSSVIGSFVADIGDLDENDHSIIMFEDRMAAIKWQMVAAKVNDVAATSAVYYWNGASWVVVSNLVDITLDAASSTKTLARTGVMSWTPPEASEEFKQELFGVTGYAYRVVFSAGITDATSIDTITGIPAPIDVKPFKFPALYKNRVMLAGFTSSNEGNRMDFSASNAPNIYNGLDSSDDGYQSLYFGGEEELSAATQLYNRFGSNIFSTLLVLKDTETYLLTGDYPGDGPDRFRQFPISFNVGCPAPLTLATAELGYEVAEDAQRNVAFWLSYSGPMMFDGAVMMPLKGVENFFDDRESECINTDYISNARGWYDQSNKEYNLLIPSGTSQVANNKWLVYSLQYKKWYEKNPGSADYPQLAFPVQDTTGTKYIYGTIDTGRLMRLENDNDWDGTVMVSEVETGDFFPSGNVWDQTIIRRVKIAARKINDDHLAYITHYPDTNVFDGSYVGFLDTSEHGWLDTGDHGWADTALASLELSLTGGPARVVRSTESSNLTAWSHRLHFEVRTNDTTKGFRPVMWGIEYRIIRRDRG